MFSCDHDWKPSYVLRCVAPDGEEVSFRTKSYCRKCGKRFPGDNPPEVEVTPVHIARTIPSE